MTIPIAGLDPATQSALLAALNAGTATMATDGGAGYQAFPVCTGAQVPTADGCVAVEKLDANHQPTTGTPDFVRFANVVGHFSTWAVAIVQATSPVTPPTTPSAPASTAPASSGPTGQRAAALGTCKKKYKNQLKKKKANDALTKPVKRKLKKCKRKANQLPV